jgi:hypothetical protein
MLVPRKVDDPPGTYLGHTPRLSATTSSGTSRQATPDIGACHGPSPLRRHESADCSLYTPTRFGSMPGCVSAVCQPRPFPAVQAETFSLNPARRKAV